MAYVHRSVLMGLQAIADTVTTQQHDIGTIVQAYDSTYGVGEFVYLKGVASTTVGSVVTYNSTTGTTTLAAIGASKSFPVAIAMSANVASQWGWYQIGGLSVMSKNCATSLAAGAAVGVLTAGFIAATGTGKEVLGAIVTAVASATAGRTTVTVLISRPHIMGRIT